MLDIVQIRRSLGLNARELSALIGSEHTTISRIDHGTQHRPGTNMLYWLLRQYGVDGISTALDYWLYHKPKHALHVELLDRIAVRYKGKQYCAWSAGMRAVHPEFFSPEKKQQVIPQAA